MSAGPAIVREELLRRRQSIMAKVGALHGDVHARAEPLNADSGEQAIELENLDVLFELDHVSRLELGKINDAIERLDNGEYGICNRCGKKIDPKRLQAVPYADTCIHCAKKDE
ncbi:MAG: TraR/DksA C4-type zinc finger protein [Spongiibacteraceae bacterium]